MICTLAQDGKTVGVTANSHKVIRNVLDQIWKAAADGDHGLVSCTRGAEL